MNRTEIDGFYHQLRILNQEEDIVQKEALCGIVSHLIGSGTAGDYEGLLRFLSYYGEEFILPDVTRLIKRLQLKFERIVDVGAGFGWLGRGLSNAFSVPVVFVDKRQWVFTDIVADVESIQGRARVLEALKSTDILVMSELIHCLDNPGDVLDPFKRWQTVVVEYDPLPLTDFRKSYVNQIKSFGCSMVDDWHKVFPHRRIRGFRSGLHSILVVDQAQ